MCWDRFSTAVSLPSFPTPTSANWFDSWGTTWRPLRTHAHEHASPSRSHAPLRSGVPQRTMRWKWRRSWSDQPRRSARTQRCMPHRRSPLCSPTDRQHARWLTKRAQWREAARHTALPGISSAYKWGQGREAHCPVARRQAPASRRRAAAGAAQRVECNAAASARAPLALPYRCIQVVVSIKVGI